MLLPLSPVTTYTKFLHTSASFISRSQAPSSSPYPFSVALAVHLEEELHLPLQGGIPQVGVRPVPLHVAYLDLCDALAAPLLFQADSQYSYMMLQHVIAALQPVGDDTCFIVFIPELSSSICFHMLTIFDIYIHIALVCISTINSIGTHLDNLELPISY